MSGIFDFIKKEHPKSTPPTQPNPSQPPPAPTRPQPPLHPVPNQPDSYSRQSTQQVVTKVTNTNQQNKLSDQELDLMTRLTQRSNKVFWEAQNKAKELQNQFIDSEHILHGLVLDSGVYQLFVDLKIQPQLVETELNKIYKKDQYKGTPQISPRVKKILDSSLVVARRLGFDFVAPEHLLVALVDEGEGMGAQILVKLGLKKEDLNKKIVANRENVAFGGSRGKSALEQYTINLNDRSAQGLLDPVVERADVIERVIHILSRRTKNNPALVGEAGVGKTAIVEGLAQKIVAKQVPDPLLTKRILQLDLMSLIAGASHRGEFEERMKDLIEEVKKNQGQVILFIDEIHNIVGAGSAGEGVLDASNFLKPALARGEMQLIGATTLTEYRKYIEKDPALERRFQPVLVQEPTEEQAIKMLKALKNKYEAFHKVTIPDQAIDAAVKLSKRYVGDRFLPDKAVDLIDEAASAVRLPLISLPEEIKSLETRAAELNQELKESQSDKVRQKILQTKIDEIQADLKAKKQKYDLKKAQTTTSVSVDTIKDTIAQWTGIPVTRITESDAGKLAHLEDEVHKRMVNQDEAVSIVAQAIRRGRAGLKSTQRPIGGFIFLGPTGVGKTELAKTIAEILFGQEEAMVRLDMTEFMEKHEVAKLIGAPPGYVGYEEGGKLTEAVRRRPYSVVLFDEVEKAHPDIFNILLQILDDGRLTDNKGHTISFKNTVIICTSNIGTPIIQENLMQQEEKTKAKKADKNAPAKAQEAFSQIKQKVIDELRRFFRPELFNRFDEIIVFEPLTLANMSKIVQLQMRGVGQLLEEQDIGFVFTEQAVEQIATVGFDPVYGARPLRRTIQRLIENPISTMIIQAQVQAGNTIAVDFKNASFSFVIEQQKLEEKSATFTCQVCGNNFRTEIVNNATTICSKCASANIKLDKSPISTLADGINRNQATLAA